MSEIPFSMRVIAKGVTSVPGTSDTELSGGVITRKTDEVPMLLIFPDNGTGVVLAMSAGFVFGGTSVGTELQGYMIRLAGDTANQFRAYCQNISATTVNLRWVVLGIIG